MKKLKGIFVTGTGTGVGKTFVACGIVRSLRKRGVDVGVLKPVSSGGTEDALLLKNAAGCSEPVGVINPVAFKMPLAPYVCTQIEKTRFSSNRVLAAYRQICDQHEFIVVEGAGGVRVPITKQMETADLILKLGLPAIVVASAKLGTINHTLLTLDYLSGKKIEVLGVVINFFDRSEITDRTNLQFFRGKKIPVFAIAASKSDNQPGFNAAANFFYRHLV